MDARQWTGLLKGLSFDAFTLFRHLPDRVTVTDRHGVILYVNPAFEKVTGYSAEEIIGKRPSVLKSGVHGPEFYRNLWDTITSGRPFRAEMVNKKRNGEFYVEDQLILPLTDRSSDGTGYGADRWSAEADDRLDRLDAGRAGSSGDRSDRPGAGSGEGKADPAGSPRWFVSIARDITERKELEARIRYLAEHDELTGLPNRRGVLAIAKRALERAAEENAPFSVLFIDLDNFKTINDGYGHRVGDLVLAAAANRIRGVVREEDVCGRWGGDEFVVLLPRTDSSAARGVARRVRAALETPARVEESAPVVYLQASVGVAAFPGDGETVEELIRIADEGMYLAKGQVSGVAHVHDRAESDSRLQLLLDIPGAVRLGQLHQSYQPILNLKTGRVEEAEALLRWRHPTRGTLRPGKFIQLAEQYRDIVAMDQWAIRKAVETAGDLKAAGVDLDIAVNVSSRTLEEGLLPASITALGESSPECLSRLIIEVTEGALVQFDKARKALDAVREQGVRVSIDDFGTGFSCMTYLEEMPADIIKIDRRFVEGIGRKRGSEAIIRSMISLAAEFDCRTVAEGVETAEQLEWLAAAGCHAAQGYWIGRPMSAKRLARLVFSGRLDRPGQAPVAAQ